jgi:hypothetical protein
MQGGHNFINMVANRYGRLTAVSLHHFDKWGFAHWLCRCDCGGTKVISGQSLRREDKGPGDRPVRSCGCLRRETARANIVAWNASDARKFLQRLWNEAKAKRKGANL